MYKVTEIGRKEVGESTGLCMGMTVARNRFFGQKGAENKNTSFILHPKPAHGLLVDQASISWPSQTKRL